MKTLTLNEVDAMSGGIVPVAWGIRVGGGAALGAASAVVANSTVMDCNGAIGPRSVPVQRSARSVVACPVGRRSRKPRG